MTTLFHTMTAIGMMGLICTANAANSQVCQPTLTIQDVQFSEMQPPTLERKWTANVTVDASRCKADSGGYFEIVFRRLSEIAPDIEFRERYLWTPPAVKVVVVVSAYEAIAGYHVEHVTRCTCPD